MAVAIRGSGSGGSPGTGNLVVTTDVGATDGDLILIFVNVNNSSSGSHPTPASTGFTSLGSSTASVWSRTTALGRIASGNGTSYTITGFTGADAKYAAVVILSGAGASLPTNIVTTPDASSNTTADIPAITNASANSMDVACVGYGGNNDYGAPGAFASWGSSLTELIDGATDSGGGAYYAGLGLATALRAASGSQAATSVTADTADVTAAIRIEVLEAAAAAASLLIPPPRLPYAILAR